MRTERRIRGAFVAGVFVLTALLLSGCGSSGPSDQEKHEAAVAKERAEERAEEKKHQAEVALAAQEGEVCTEELGEFLESLEELEGRLQIGLSYDDYFAEVGNVQVAYNKIPIQELEPECLGKVGVPSEKAFNAYVEAAEAWDTCFEELSCESSDPTLQRKWAKAGRQMARAQRGLVEVGEP